VKILKTKVNAGGTGPENVTNLRKGTGGGGAKLSRIANEFERSEKTNWRGNWVQLRGNRRGAETKRTSREERETSYRETAQEHVAPKTVGSLRQPRAKHLSSAPQKGEPGHRGGVTSSLGTQGDGDWGESAHALEQINKKITQEMKRRQETLVLDLTKKTTLSIMLNAEQTAENAKQQHLIVIAQTTRSLGNRPETSRKKTLIGVDWSNYKKKRVRTRQKKRAALLQTGILGDTAHGTPGFKPDKAERDK